jgi:hypothetical protein
MKKQQWLLILGGVLLIAVIYFGTSTDTPKSSTSTAPATQDTHNHSVTIEDLLAKARQRISPEQVQRLALLEQAVVLVRLCQNL